MNIQNRQDGNKEQGSGVWPSYSSGEPSWEISVPVEWFDAARCLLDKSRFTDAELAFLATGVLDGNFK
jgi:hypothetical protein